MKGRHTTARVAVLAATLLAFGSSAAPSGAATQIGTGGDSSIAVDGDGMTHVAWNESKPGETDVLHYCRIPRGARACGDEQQLLPFPEQPNFDVDGPQVLLGQPGEVMLLTYRVGVNVNGEFGNVLYFSDQNGAPGSFDAPTFIGTNGPSGRPAVFDTTDGLVVTVSASRTGGTFVQGAPIEGGFTTSEAHLSMGQKAYEGTVVRRGPGSYAAAYSDFENVYVRTFTCDGAGCARLGINSELNWSAEVTVPEAQSPRLASGPAGTFLMYHSRPADGGPTQWMVRQLNGTQVGAPTPIGNPGSGGVRRDIFQDATGLTHTVFIDENTALVDRSSTDGSTWRSPTILAPGPDFRVSDPRVAFLNHADGFTGFAVWTSFEGSSNSPIVIEPLPPPAAPEPPGPAGPATGPPMNVKAPQIRPGVRAGLYVCDEGEWVNLPPNPEFEYFWYHSADPSSGAFYELVGTDYAYTLPPDQVGDSFYCGIRVTNEFGTGAALSEAITLGTRPYGDVAVKGIDLFQTTQPSACANMWTVPPLPWGEDVGFGARLPSDPFRPLDGWNYAGGGTPTAYRAFSVGCVEEGLAPGANPARVNYEGVTLDADKPTTAVVYLGMLTKGGGFTAGQDLEVTLSFLSRGRRFASLTQVVENPPDSRRPFVITPERDNPGAGGVAFNVPGFVTYAVSDSDDLSVEARVAFPAADAASGAHQCDPPGRCNDNDRFRLDGVPVRDMPLLFVGSVGLTGRPPATRSTINFRDPDQVLARGRQLWPGGEKMIMLPYLGFLDLGFEMNLSGADHECSDIKLENDVRGCRQAYISPVIRKWSAENGASGSYDILMAVHDYLDNNGGSTEGGWTLGGPRLATYTPGRGNQPIFTTTVKDRPITAAAHELGHVYTAPHAGQSCPGAGTGEKQEGEPWSPDGQGRLWSVKFDRMASGDRTTVDKQSGFLSNGLDASSNVFYDLMSYCVNAVSDADSWVSARNWNRAIEVMLDLKSRPRSSPKPVGAAGATTASVVGVLGPTGEGRISRVTPTDSGDQLIPVDPSSPVRLRALDAGGQVIGETGVDITPSTESDSSTFLGYVPAAATEVQLVRDGQVLDRRTRSQPPQVRVLAPRRGALARARRNLLVRWSATDPDNDPLQATVEYSPDAGRNWLTVYDGASQGGAQIPGRLLAGSDRARVRVRVSDGFNEARAVSALFRSEGRPPEPQIERPAVGEPVRAGDRTVLVGTAIDDRNRQLRGRSLTWFVGRRAIGRGERPRVRLNAGRVRLRLVARDASGRTGSTTRTVRVTPVPLRITRLRVPPTVRRSASTVTVRLAASGPAILRARGQRFSVGTRTRRLVLRLPRRPARGELRVPIDLRANGPVVRGRVRATLVVMR